MTTFADLKSLCSKETGHTLEHLTYTYDQEGIPWVIATDGKVALCVRLPSTSIPMPEPNHALVSTGMTKIVEGWINTKISGLPIDLEKLRIWAGPVLPLTTEEPCPDCADTDSTSAKGSGCRDCNGTGSAKSSCEECGTTHDCTCATCDGEDSCTTCEGTQVHTITRISTPGKLIDIYIDRAYLAQGLYAIKENQGLAVTTNEGLTLYALDGAWILKLAPYNPRDHSDIPEFSISS